MKPIFIYPVVTAILGFFVGWIAKPTPEPIIVRASQKSPDSRNAPARPTQISPTAPENSPPPLISGSRPVYPSSPDTPETVASQDDAKMARLVEALGLSPEQQQAIRKAMADARDTLNPQTPADPGQQLNLAVTAGQNVEKALAATFTPEQAAAFADLRKRAEDNSVETTSQNRISSVAKLVDLTPEQREKALSGLRESVRASYQSRPPGLALVLDTSPLPTGPSFIADASVDRLRHFSSATGDPGENQASYHEIQRRNLDAQAAFYQDILTPAQLARLKLDIDEKKAAIDRVSEMIR